MLMIFTPLKDGNTRGRTDLTSEPLKSDYSRRFQGRVTNSTQEMQEWSVLTEEGAA